LEVNVVEEEDPLYLKNFIKLHPDNKMGWYLLGKQYEALGKEGKAKYCFEQAGEVYEAFEKASFDAAIALETKANADAEALRLETQAHSLKANRIKHSLVLGFRLVTILFVVLFLFTYLPSAAIDQSVENKASDNKNTVYIAPPEKELNIYYISGDNTKDELKEALHKMMTANGVTAKLSIIVQAKRSDDGKWVMWQNAVKPLLSAQRTAETGTLEIQYHDNQLCDCLATDGTNAIQRVNEWMTQQEQMLILRSAMAVYEKKYGPLPDTIEQITRNYPQNLLPGYTDMMKKAYVYYKQTGAFLKSEQSTPQNVPSVATVQPQQVGQDANSSLTTDHAKASPKPSNKPLVKEQDKSSAVDDLVIVPPLTAPLEIVVDQTTHQLALVSGPVILRKYSVGLGGDKTPQGSFTITEKVRNPNGHDNGDFGSRGMALSDSLYAIHGTNQPASIGADESHGCVRMAKEDIEELYDMTPLGTKVTIGQMNLPTQPINGKTRFRLPLLREETNPGRIYKWLN
jgi:lipoprotein-anchoring transpeptidase ErfK/SrfK